MWSTAFIIVIKWKKKTKSLSTYSNISFLTIEQFGRDFNNLVSDNN